MDLHVGNKGKLPALSWADINMLSCLVHADDSKAVNACNRPCNQKAFYSMQMLPAPLPAPVPAVL